MTSLASGHQISVVYYDKLINVSLAGWVDSLDLSWRRRHKLKFHISFVLKCPDVHITCISLKGLVIDDGKNRKGPGGNGLP